MGRCVPFIGSNNFERWLRPARLANQPFIHKGDQALKPDELNSLQSYLRKTFGTPNLSVRARPKKTDSAEVYIGDEFIAVLYKEEEDGELSYQFQMAILDIDLDDNAVG